MRAAADGVGFGVFSKLLAMRYVAEGSLVRALPEWILGRLGETRVLRPWAGS